ncbi:Glycosyltransferase [Halanaeroarchaeum sp. HSR-CO]|uniref:glycosyltransferase family 4 protein n=1 Tax=Halanaeroarchaeum sp. HSR-CO TaxID=2866382 RepID=UPI00217DE13D|nr:glycosyltransferase family 4 protein [Halanaeroarchaeum sp. HSR-CO]UWG48066.1 Glycosyltransferase [Halanaeroarchaeum sp. HSR-CO]
MTTRIAICTHFSIEHFRGGEKWAVNLANDLVKDDSIAVSVRSLPYAPNGDRKVVAEDVLDEAVPYVEAWRHDLAGVDAAYVMYHPGASVVNFHGADHYIAGIHSWLYVSPQLFEQHYGVIPTVTKLAYRAFGRYDLDRYDAVHSVTPVTEHIFSPSIFIPNFVDTTLFEPDRASLFDRFTAFVPAAHIDEKGWDISRAVAARASPDISFITTGTTDSPDIETTGFLSERELADLYSRSHVVLHPARVDTDSMVINEAIASGTPVVTTPLPTHVRENDAIVHASSVDEIVSVISGLASEFSTTRGAYDARSELARTIAADRSKEKILPKLQKLLTTVADSAEDLHPDVTERTDHRSALASTPPGHAEEKL